MYYFIIQTGIARILYRTKIMDTTMINETTEAATDITAEAAKIRVVKKSRTLRYPALSEIRLLPGTPFYDRQQDMNEFLLGQDDDSMLYNFRTAAGLPTLGAKALKGWDAEDSKLRGHTTGHYMSGLALAYAVTGDARFKDKLDYIIKGLAECQAAFSGKEGFRPGFLSAYSEEQFDLLEQGTPYPEIWAPYYTLDKIMSGLLDAYDLTDNEQALEILIPLGDWVYNRLSRLSSEARNTMWDTYIAGEYGCMIVTMVRLYRISGKEEHLKAAKLFSNPVLFEQMAEGLDELDNMHANQHIPQIMGVVELYEETGDCRYYEMACNFEEIVTAHHCYAIGGTGEQERFRAPDRECRLLTENTAESCASYNMLRLTSGLYRYNTDPHLMSYYENTLFNHILASFSHKPDGGTSYFMPLEPGSFRHYDREDENSCCHGTGFETRYRYMQQIFSYHSEPDAEHEILRIELPISAILGGDEKLTLRFDVDGTFTITADADMKRRIAVRVPAWTKADEIDYDGRPDAEFKDGYMTLTDTLTAGESVKMTVPVQVRINAVSSNPHYCYLSYGPYILAAMSDRKDLMPVPDPASMTPILISHAVPNKGSAGSNKRLYPVSGADNKGIFSAGEIMFMPFYMADEQPCHVYLYSKSARR